MTSELRYPIANRTGRFSVRMLLLVFAFLTIAGVLMATSIESASAKAGDRPFKGVMVNNDQVIGATVFEDGPFVGLVHTVTVLIEGEIVATHLGKGDVSGLVTIDISGFYTGGCSSIADGTDGIISFTAANGDVVDMEMELNQLCPISPTESVFTGQYDVIGGTGRFADADGLIDVSAVLINGESTSESRLDGTIVY